MEQRLVDGVRNRCEKVESSLMSAVTARDCSRILFSVYTTDGLIWNK